MIYSQLNVQQIPPSPSILRQNVPDKSLPGQMPSRRNPTNRVYSMFCSQTFPSKQQAGIFKSNLSLSYLKRMFSAIRELNITPLKVVHVYSPDSERSDKWMVECGSSPEANQLLKNPPFLFGRMSR